MSIYVKIYRIIKFCFPFSKINILWFLLVLAVVLLLLRLVLYSCVIESTKNTSFTFLIWEKFWWKFLSYLLDSLLLLPHRTGNTDCGTGVQRCGTFLASCISLEKWRLKSHLCPRCPNLCSTLLYQLCGRVPSRTSECLFPSCLAFVYIPYQIALLGGTKWTQDLWRCRCPGMILHLLHLLDHSSKMVSAATLDVPFVKDRTRIADRSMRRQNHTEEFIIILSVTLWKHYKGPSDICEWVTSPKIHHPPPRAWHMVQETNHHE